MGKEAAFTPVEVKQSTPVLVTHLQRTSSFLLSEVETKPNSWTLEGYNYFWDPILTMTYYAATLLSLYSKSENCWPPLAPL